MTHLWILCVGQSVCSTLQAHIYNNSGILMLLQTWHRSFFNSNLLSPAKLFSCQKTNEHRHQPPRQRIGEPVSGAKMGSLNVTSEFILSTGLLNIQPSAVPVFPVHRSELWINTRRVHTFKSGDTAPLRASWETRRPIGQHRWLLVQFFNMVEATQYTRVTELLRRFACKWVSECSL